MLPILIAVGYGKEPDIETVPDRHASTVSEALNQQVQSNPDRYAQTLVDALVDGARDPRTKVRRIHDWVALNIAYDADRYLSGATVDGDWVSTLRNGSAVCEGYANVFGHLLDLAGVENRVIAGYGRGHGYDPFVEEEVLANNHVWNQVKIGDQWFLIDVTWDAGGLTADGAFAPQYSTRYFLADPAVFVRTHLPAQPSAETELLPEPVDPANFRRLPPVRPPFGSDLTLLVPSAPHSNVYGFDAMAVVRAKADTHVSAVMVRANGTPLVGAVLTDRIEDTVRMRIRFPEPGNYWLHVFVDGQLSAQLAYTSHAVPLPRTFSSWDSAFTLVEPMDRVPGTAPRITVQLPGVESAVLVIGQHAVPMLKDGIRFTSPDYDPDAQQVLVAIGDTNHWTGLIVF